MAVAEVDPNANRTSDLPNGSSSSSNAAAAAADKKKSRESERRRRRKQKKSKAAVAAAAAGGDGSEVDEEEGEGTKENAEPNPQVEVEYVPEKAELDDGLLDDFRTVFEKFSFKDPTADTEGGEKEEEAGGDAAKTGLDSDDEEQETQQKKEGGLSNKQKKLQRRMKIAELKQICNRPDVVEGKGGIKKQPFQLPDFIAATGIEKLRQAYIEEEDSKKLKQEIVENI